MTTEAHVTHYTVRNRITGKVRQFKSGRAASRYMDQADNAYGSYITTRKAHWSEEAAPVAA